MTDTPKITEADIARLRELALAATPGPWEAEVDDGNGTVEVNAGTARTKWSEDGGWGIPASSWRTTDRILERDDLWDNEFEQSASDADFIAAVNPQMILALLAERDKEIFRLKQIMAILEQAQEDGLDVALVPKEENPLAAIYRTFYEPPTPDGQD